MLPLILDASASAKDDKIAGQGKHGVQRQEVEAEYEAASGNCMTARLSSASELLDCRLTFKRDSVVWGFYYGVLLVTLLR